MSDPKTKTRDSKPRDVVFTITATYDGEILVEDVRISTKFDGEPSENEVFVVAKDEFLTLTEKDGKTTVKITATDEELRQDAVSAFEEKYDGIELEDDHIRGPFYDRKGMGITQGKPRKRRASLQVDLDKVRFGKIDGVSSVRAEFNDWNVIAQYVANPEECVVNYDPSTGKAVMVMFKSPVNKGDKKKIVPPSRFVSESDLKNVEKIAA